MYLFIALTRVIVADIVLIGNENQQNQMQYLFLQHMRVLKDNVKKLNNSPQNIFKNI